MVFAATELDQSDWLRGREACNSCGVEERKTMGRTLILLGTWGVLLLGTVWNADGQARQGAAGSSGSPFTGTGEPVVAVLGCVDADDDRSAATDNSIALRLTHVQRGSISAAGVTGSEGPMSAPEWTRNRSSDGDVEQGADANPARRRADSAAMLPRTEYALEPLEGIELASYEGHQVRITGIIHDRGDEATLQVMNVRPIGALCAGRH